MAREFEVNFKENLKSQRRILTKSARKKEIKQPNWLFPSAWELKYVREVRNNIQKRLKPIVQNEIDQNWLRWSAEKQANDRMDAWTDEVRRMIERLKAEMTGVMGADGEDPKTSSIWPVLGTIALGIYFFNKKQWGKQTKKVLGYEFETDDSWWPGVKESWSGENYEFFRDLSNDYIKRINEVVYRGVRNNWTKTDIAKEISNIDKTVFGPKYKINPKTGRRIKVQSRAELIARDQIGKLNGEISKKRMTEVGLMEYEWLTAMDERVRGRPGGRYPKAIPSHWDMQGKICSWEDDSVYADKSDFDERSGIINWRQRTTSMSFAQPGEEIQCRCTSVPFWGNMLKDVDEDL